MCFYAACGAFVVSFRRTLDFVLRPIIVTDHTGDGGRNRTGSYRLVPALPGQYRDNTRKTAILCEGLQNY